MRPKGMNGTNERYENNTLGIMITITEPVRVLSLGTNESYTMRLEHDTDRVCSAVN